MSLSKERLRIAEASHLVGKFSGLDYQQAKVDFNADSAQYIKQQELLHSSRIQLNELMANNNVNQIIVIKDSTIDVHSDLLFDDLWNATLSTNASLLKADQNTVLAQLDYKKINSRNYPYLKLNTGYGYTFNKYDINANSRRGNLGFNAGVTVGFNIFDGNRRREKRNATLAFKNRRLERQELELALRSDLSNLWQAYRNNLQLLNLERQNLVTAKDNHDIAMDRYIQETFPVLKYARHKRVCWMPKNVFSRQNTTPNFAKFHYCKSAEKSPNIWSNKTLILLFSLG